MCGYCMTGLERPVCPECGAAVAEILARHAGVPWLAQRRGLLIRYVDFWRTVWSTSFGRTREILFEVFHPVDYRSTRRFAWLAALHAWLAVLHFLFGIVWVDRFQARALRSPGFDLFFADAVTSAMSTFWLLCLLATLLAIAGFPTYFFHPRSRPVDLQNRLLALSYLAAGPLAWALPVSAATCSVAMVQGAWGGETTLLCGGVLMSSVLVLWYLRVVRLAMRLIPGSTRWVAIGVPLLALLITLLVSVVIPVAVAISLVGWLSRS